jgi:UDP-glucuronate 4-epimerase
MNKILVTGCAGFIGFHLSKFLLEKNYNVIGIDNLNNYYDVNLKKQRIKILKNYKKFELYKFDIAKKNYFNRIKYININMIFHFAAQAGVRYSLTNPENYLNSNIVGTFNILEFAKKNKIKNFFFASSSSVYGNLNKKKFSENDNTDNPLQFYAATKKSAEVMIKSYSSLYGIKSTIFRFFSVYGPYGRPDMAIYDFVEKVLNNKKISVFNNGEHSRDFTFIDDLIKCIYHISFLKKSNKKLFYNIYNIAAGKNVKLKKLIEHIENLTSKTARIKYTSFQKGDMKDTHANVNKLKKDFSNYRSTNLKIGLKNFIKWYKHYKNEKN